MHDITIYDLDYYHVSHMACFMQELLLGMKYQKIPRKNKKNHLFLEGQIITLHP